MTETEVKLQPAIHSLNNLESMPPQFIQFGPNVITKVNPIDNNNGIIDENQFNDQPMDQVPHMDQVDGSQTMSLSDTNSETLIAKNVENDHEMISQNHEETQQLPQNQHKVCSL